MDYLTIDNFEKGVVFDLLCRAFEPIMNDELEAKLQRYDKEIFDNPKTVGASLFLARVDGELVGMASWDPRQFPKAIVGYNCILPEFQGKRFGKQQLLELLRRLKASGFTDAAAKTGDHPFYEPSQNMFKSCGFDEINRCQTSSDPRYGSIDYHLVL
jgi:GNAT superfamily N-acetyltransferase